MPCFYTSIQLPVALALLSFVTAAISPLLWQGRSFVVAFDWLEMIQALHLLNRMECHRVLLLLKRPFGLDQSPLVHSTHSHQPDTGLYLLHRACWQEMDVRTSFTRYSFRLCYSFVWATHTLLMSFQNQIRFRHTQSQA